MKTRPKPGQASKASTRTGPSDSTTKTLDPSDANPPSVCILPKDASAAARIITLDEKRLFVCPEKGFYEFTRIAAPRGQCRSWLLAPERLRKRRGDHMSFTEAAPTEPAAGSNMVAPKDQGYVLQLADLLVATPMDPLFLLIPILAPEEHELSKQMFLSFSDHLDSLVGRSLHLKHVLLNNNSSKLVDMLEARMTTICDAVDAGEEKMYRLSLTKLLDLLLEKAKKMSSHCLPASMEERFVRQALVVPAFSIKREESTVSMVEKDASSGAESQTTTAIAATCESQTSAVTELSIIATTVDSQPSAPLSAAPAEVTRLLRLRTAFNFILSSHIPSHLRTHLTTLTSSSTSPIDFTPLDKHLSYLATLKRDAQALRAISDNVSRKRSAVDDEEAEAVRAEKKRKNNEDEVKKKNMSRGVQQLKKVDTSGMKKMSSFFAKAPFKK